MSTLAELVVRIAADTSGFTAGIAKANAEVSAMSKNMVRQGETMMATGKKMTRAFTLPAVLIGAAAIKMSTDFHASMTQIQTQAGGTAKDVKVLSDRVLELAPATQQGPEELAKALYHLKSLGYDNAKAMGLLKAAAKGASMGQADLEETTSALGAAIVTGVKGMGNASHAMGILNAIIGAGNMRMEDLNAALGTGILASAKSFGISIQDVGGALARLTDMGMSANSAATRLRMSFSLMGAPTETAAKAMKGIGLQATTLAQAMRGPGGLEEALRILQAHLDGLSKVDQAATLTKMFGGGRSSTAILALLSNLDTLDGKIKQISRTSGDFAKDFAATQKTAAYQFGSAWSTIQVSLIHLGDTLAPIALGAAHAIAGLVSIFDKLPSPVKSSVVGFVALLAMIGPMVRIVGRLTTSFGLLLGAFGAAGKALATFMTIEGAEMGLAEAMATRMAMVGAAFDGLIVQIQAAGAAMLEFAPEIAVVAAALVALTAVWVAASHAAEEQHKAIEASGPLLIAYAKNAAAGAHSLSDLHNMVRTQIQDAIDSGASISEVNDIMGQGRRALQIYQDAVEQHGVKAVRELTDVQVQAKEAIANFAGMSGKAIADWAKGVTQSNDVVQNAFDAIANKAKLTSDEVINSFKKQIEAQLNFQKNLKTLANEGLSQYAAATLASMGKAGAAVAAALVDGPKANIKEYNRLLDQGESLTNNFSSYVQGIYEQMAAKAHGAAGRMATYILNEFSRIQVEAAQAGRNLGLSFAGGMNSSQEAVVKAAFGLANAAMATVKGKLKIHSPSKVFEEIGRDIVRGLAIGLRDTGAVTDALGNLVDRIDSQVGKAVDKIKKQMGHNLQTIQNQLDKATSDAGKAATAAANAAAKAQTSAAKAAAQAQIDQLNAFSKEWKAKAAALQKDGEKIVKNFSDLMDRVQNFRDNITGGFSGFGDLLGAFSGKTFRTPAMVAELQKWQDELARVQKEAATVQASGEDINEGFQAYIDYVSGKVDSLSQAMGGTITGSDISNYFQQQVAQATQFSDLLKQLAQKGLSVGLLQELASGGQDAVGIMQALLSDSSGELIKAANASQKTIDDIMKSTADKLQDFFFGKQMQQAAADLASFDQRVQAFISNMANAADKVGLNGDRLVGSLGRLTDSIDQLIIKILQGSSSTPVLQKTAPTVPDPTSGSGGTGKLPGTSGSNPLKGMMGDIYNLHGDIVLPNIKGAKDAEELLGAIKQVVRQGGGKKN